MSALLERIDQTRELLLQALANQDWATITELDISCRICVEDVLAESVENEQAVRESLGELLEVYRQLIDVTSVARQSVVDEMTQIRQAKNAAKVYHLLS